MVTTTVRPATDERLHVRPDLRESFAALGWHTLEDVMDSDVPDVMRTVGPAGRRRDNCRVTLPAAGGRGPLACYLKRHWTAHGPDPGVVEAEAAAECERHGVPVLKVAAHGAGDDGRGGRVSFFLSEAVPGVPADDFWPGVAGDRVRAERTIDALADAARRLHAAGLFHRDLYWCHFFVHEVGDKLTCRLIDLQRIVRPRWPTRWRLKDVAQFRFSTPAGVGDDLMRRWLRVYCGGRVGLRQRLWWRAVGVRAALYARRERRR